MSNPETLYIPGPPGYDGARCTIEQAHHAVGGTLGCIAGLEWGTFGNDRTRGTRQDGNGGTLEYMASVKPGPNEPEGFSFVALYPGDETTVSIDLSHTANIPIVAIDAGTDGLIEEGILPSRPVLKVEILMQGSGTGRRNFVLDSTTGAETRWSFISKASSDATWVSGAPSQEDLDKAQGVYEALQKGIKNMTNREVKYIGSIACYW